ncbi:alpha/beta hydrolase [Aquisphaera insulae]|uniref:alpha/beta hydrolase n=1 Tax=Aquisphaera insulae TaxID=2712864 RepID=UPI0013EAD152|nr:alpha/beta hydrolase [Aquisphaera insulae]
MLDQGVLNDRLFFPARHDVPDAFLVQSHGARLACRRLAAFPEGGTLLHFHGNGESASDYADGELAEILTNLGVNACFGEYRGYGMSSGVPSLVAMLSDGEAIVRALGVPPERLVVYGRSIGSLYAIELVRRLPNVAGLILESGIADLLERILVRVTPEDLDTTAAGLSREVLAHFDNRLKLGGYRGPVLVLHARHDDLVRPHHAEKLHAWSGGADRELVIFPRGDHNTLIALNFEDYSRRVGAFLRRVGMASR